MSIAPIKHGEYTSTIYGLIRDRRYNDVIRILQYEVQRATNNQAGLSLLAYCYYYTQDYVNAAACYEKLTKLYPSNGDYRIRHAQALYNAFNFTDAFGVLAQVEEPEHVGSVIKLMSAIRYREEDVRNARKLLEQYDADDPDTDINLACLEYKEGKYDEALQRFYKVSDMLGYQAELAYAIALCHYRKKEYPQAVRFIGDIIDRGIKEHPELSVGAVTEGLEVRSVGNTLLLHETALVEACNLKFAIEYQLKNMNAASEALTDMPPRSEEELDAVTLHNQALISVDTQPADGFAKLQFLLSQNPFPPEAFANLLLLYCKYEYIDLAADVLAENAHLTYKLLTPFMFEYLDAVISQATSPEEAYNKFDALAQTEVAELRRLTQRIQELSGQMPSNEEQVRRAIADFDKSLERYIPVIMAQGRVFWERGEYGRVEKLFQHCVEFASEHPVFRLNVAHTLFMQGEKFKEAAGFYEPIIKKNYEKLLDVHAIVLANLCVCYIMTNQNEEAEELIRKVEREEEEIRLTSSSSAAGTVPGIASKTFHLCIINLVIGTLYCNKGNHEFGISRVIKAMEPYERKLGTDTWFYAKRCILATVEAMSRHIIAVRDTVIDELLVFLEKCEEYGEGIPASVDGPLLEAQIDSIKNSVAYEARQLRAVVLDVIEF